MDSKSLWFPSSRVMIQHAAAPPRAAPVGTLFVPPQPHPPANQALYSWLTSKNLQDIPFLHQELNKFVDTPEEIADLGASDIADVLKALELGGLKRAKLNKVQNALQTSGTESAELAADLFNSKTDQAKHLLLIGNPGLYTHDLLGVAYL